MTDITSKLDVREIVTSCNMSARPEYYSGRGAITSDLNYDILQKIYKKIENLDKNAAKNFVRMVRDIPKMSATDFLINLYNLESNKWKWNKNLLNPTKGVYVNGETDEQKFANGMFTIAEVRAGNNERDETHSIKDGFLIKHGIKLKNRESFFYF